jgi:hypothetical protein
MALLVTHTTAADGTFSSTGATAWNATHAIAGTLDLATETTGSLDLVTRSTGSLDLATRTTGSLDLTARSTGTIDLLTQTRGATANQLMYGGASGQVAQTSQMAWSAADNRLTVSNSTGLTSTAMFSDGFRKTASTSTLLLKGFEATTGTSNGGGVDLRGGPARTNGGGGTVTMRGGNAVGATGGNNGGNIDAVGGFASTTDPTGAGGNVYFQGGDAYGASAYSGSCSLICGSVSSGGIAGSVEISAGNAIGSTGTPGNIDIFLGGQTAGSVIGNISIASSTGTPVAVTAGTGTTHAVDLPVIVDGTQYYIRLYS